MAFPTTPNNGDTTTINSVLYTYDSSKNAWLRLAPIITGTTTGAITVSATAPTLTVNDQVHIWINSSTNDQYVLIPSGNTTQWKELVGSGINGATGATGPSGDDSFLFPDPGATGATGATGLIPAISTIVVTDQYWEPLPYANSVDINGGYIRITGVGFRPNCRAFVGQYITATTYIKETEVGAIVPALPIGFYTGYVVNPGGGTAELVDGIHCHPLPQWVTTSPLPSAKALVPTNIQLNVTDATNFRMAAGSSLPPGLTLQQHGLINGAVQSAYVPSTTTFNFTVVATDAELQDAVRALTLVVAPVAGVEWTSGVIAAFGGGSVRSIAYSNERTEFVAVSTPGFAARSTDGLVWTRINSFPTTSLFNWPHLSITWNPYRDEYVTYFDDQHVVVGQGNSWTKSNLGPFYAYSITWINFMSSYVASGMNLADPIDSTTFTKTWLRGVALSGGVDGDPNRYLMSHSYQFRSTQSFSYGTVTMELGGGTVIAGIYPGFSFVVKSAAGTEYGFDVGFGHQKIRSGPYLSEAIPSAGNSYSINVGGSTLTFRFNGAVVYTRNITPGQIWYASYVQSIPSTVDASFNWSVSQMRPGTMVSGDGINWTSSGSMGVEWGNTLKVTCVIWSPELVQCLAVGLSGRGATSGDGLTWTYHRQPISAYAGVWDGSRYVIGGSGGLLASSTDGINWITLVGLRDSTVWGSATIQDINWNGSQYLVVGQSGRTAISQDLFNWRYTGGWTVTDLYAIAWDSTAYVVGVGNHSIGRST